MCVRSRSRGVRSPPPWVVWLAHLARSRHWALVGPFHVVRAPPRVLPRSLAPSGVLMGGRSGPGSPLLGLGLWGWRKGVPGGVPSTVARGVWGQALPFPRLPAHWAGCRGPLPTCRERGRVGVGALHCPPGLHALWGLRATGVVGGRPPTWLGAVRPPWGGSVAFVCRGAGWGGGGVRRAPRLCGPGGPVGRGVALPSSVPLPSLGRQQSGCHWRHSVHSGSFSPAFTGRNLCGVLPRWRGLACSLRFMLEPAAGAGGAGRAPAPLSGGGRGDHPPCLGACGPAGGVGGGSRRGLPAPPLGGGPRFPTLAPLLSSAHPPPACACGRGRGAVPGWGGMRGGPWTAPPGAPADLNLPSALLEWAVVMGG